MCHKVRKNGFFKNLVGRISHLSEKTLEIKHFLDIFRQRVQFQRVSQVQRFLSSKQHLEMLSGTRARKNLPERGRVETTCWNSLVRTSQQTEPTARPTRPQRQERDHSNHPFEPPPAGLVRMVVRARLHFYNRGIFGEYCLCLEHSLVK